MMRTLAAALTLVLLLGATPARGDLVESFAQIYDILEDLGLYDSFIYDRDQVETIIHRHMGPDVEVSHGVVFEYCFERVIDNDVEMTDDVRFAMQTALSIMIYHWSRLLNLGEVTSEMVALDRTATRRAVGLMRMNGSYQDFASMAACTALARSSTGYLT